MLYTYTWKFALYVFLCFEKLTKRCERQRPRWVRAAVIWIANNNQVGYSHIFIAHYPHTYAFLMHFTRKKTPLIKAIFFFLRYRIMLFFKINLAKWVQNDERISIMVVYECIVILISAHLSPMKLRTLTIRLNVRWTWSSKYSSLGKYWKWVFWVRIKVVFV